MPYYYAMYHESDPDPTVDDLKNLSSTWSTNFAIAHGTYTDPTPTGYGFKTMYQYVDPQNEYYRYAVIFSESGYESEFILSHPHICDITTQQWTPYMDTLGVVAHWRLNDKYRATTRRTADWSGGTAGKEIMNHAFACVQNSNGDPDNELYFSGQYLRFRIDHVTGTDTDYEVRCPVILSGDFDIYCRIYGFSGLTGGEIFLGIESTDDDWYGEIGAIDTGTDFEYTLSHTANNVASSRSSTAFWLRIQRVGTNIKFHVYDGAGTGSGMKAIPGTWVQKYSNTNATYNADDVRLYIHLKIGSGETTGSKYLELTKVEEYDYPDSTSSYLFTDRIGDSFGYIIGDPTKEVTSLITNDHSFHMTTDGTNDWFDLTVSRTIIENAVFSVVGCFKTSYTSGSQALMCAQPEGSETNGRGWKIYLDSSGYINFVYGDGSGSYQTTLTSTSSGFNDGNPHNFVLAFGGNGNAIDVYVDGSSEISSTAAVAITYTDNGSGNSAFFGIGAEINSSSAMINQFNGTLGDFALTTDVITSTEAGNIDDDFNGI